ASPVVGEGSAVTVPTGSPTGMSRSRTVVVPGASSALHATGVTPTGKRVADVGAHTAATSPSTRSCAATTKVTCAPLAPAASNSATAGAIRSGPVVSTTVMEYETGVAALPERSCAVHSSTVSPSGNVDPGASGVHCAVTASRSSTTTRA